MERSSSSSESREPDQGRYRAYQPGPSKKSPVGLIVVAVVVATIATLFAAAKGCAPDPATPAANQPAGK